MKTKNIRLSFVGDICLAGKLKPELRKYGPDHAFKKIHDCFTTSDLVIGNLECCVIEGEEDAGTPDNIMLVPEVLAEGLTRSGIHVVSLANNHILDAGEPGLSSTQRFLDKNGIHYFGAGIDMQAAEQALLLTCKGIRLAFLGACDVPWVFAADTKAGVAPMLAQNLSRRIANCKKMADVVILSLHADIEFSPYPSPSRVKLSRWLVEQGADLVIQHHPHVCQGIEMHGDGLIAYSLGNFVFGSKDNEYFVGRNGTDWAVVLNVDLTIVDSRKKISYDLLPVTINNKNATEVSLEMDCAGQLAYVHHISDHLADHRLLRRQRFKRCLAEAKSNLYGLYYMGRRKGFMAALKSGLALLMNPYERRWMYSLLTLGELG